MVFYKATSCLAAGLRHGGEGGGLQGARLHLGPHPGPHPQRDAEGWAEVAQGRPQVVILCLITVEDNHSPAEEIWGALSRIGVCPGREHCIYGEPRELLTQVWVREGYLEYRQVPDSNLARYEFLWHPWAYAETSKWLVT